VTLATHTKAGISILTVLADLSRPIPDEPDPGGSEKHYVTQPERINKIVFKSIFGVVLGAATLLAASQKLG
jgi:hypothetical protein